MTTSPLFSWESHRIIKAEAFYSPKSCVITRIRLHMCAYCQKKMLNIRVLVKKIFMIVLDHSDCKSSFLPLTFCMKQWLCMSQKWGQLLTSNNGDFFFYLNVTFNLLSTASLTFHCTKRVEVSVLTSHLQKAIPETIC